MNRKDKDMKLSIIHLLWDRDCKHSKVFKPSLEQHKQDVDGIRALSAIYIHNEALVALGNPKAIKV